MTERAESRRNPRFDVENVPGMMAFTVDAKVLNISRSGIAVETSFQLVIGRRYIAKIGYRGRSVRTAGTVRRCRLKKTRETETGEVEPVYEVGIKFDDILSEKQSELMPIVAKNASLQIKPRLYGRFRPDQDQSVILKSNVGFEVKRLSLSGLLVETDASPERDAIVSLELEINGEQFASAGRVVDLSKVHGAERIHRSQLGVEFVEMTSGSREILKTYLLDQVERDF